MYESLGGSGAAASPRANSSNSSKQVLRFSLSKQWSSSSGSDATEQLLRSSSSYTDLHSLARSSPDEPRGKRNELGTISVR